MKITKLGHCCLLVEEKGVRILTDPGAWTSLQNNIMDIDAVLITHEHQDHLHMDSLKIVLKNNPDVKIITNASVGKLLNKEGIEYETIDHGKSVTVKNILIEGYGTTHADIYKEVTPVENTGYFIADRFFYPGDALFHLEKPVEILALPVAGPWIKISEAIEYGKVLKPKMCFPVHDGMLSILGPFHALPQKFLSAEGIDFRILEEGKEYEF